MQFDKGPSWASVGLRGLALTTLGVGIHLQAQAVGLNQMSATASENAVVTDSTTRAPPWRCRSRPQ